MTCAFLPTRSELGGATLRPTSERGEDQVAEQDFVCESDDVAEAWYRRAEAVGGGRQQGACGARGRVACDAGRGDGSGSGSLSPKSRDAHKLAIEAAVVAQRCDMLQELLMMRVDPNMPLSTGTTALTLASSRGSLDVAAALLAHGADPNLADDAGSCPLHAAARAGHSEAAHLLLSGGALPTILDADGRSAAQVAVGEAVSRLLRHADGASSLSSSRLPALNLSDGDSADDDDRGGGSCAVGAMGVRPSSSRAATRTGDCDLDGDAVPSYPSSDPRAVPRHPSGGSDLLRDLQQTLCSKETDIRRILTLPGGIPHEVQCDVERDASSSHYRCFLRLKGSDSRTFVFEASRSRKGKMANSHYRLCLPRDDGRLRPASDAGTPGEDPLFCGARSMRQWRVESGKGVSGRWKVESCEWRVESGKCRVESGKGRVESGEWKVVDPCSDPCSRVDPCSDPGSAVDPCSDPCSAVDPCSDPTRQASYDPTR